MATHVWKYVIEHFCSVHYGNLIILLTNLSLKILWISRICQRSSWAVYLISWARTRMAPPVSLLFNLVSARSPSLWLHYRSLRVYSSCCLASLLCCWNYLEITRIYFLYRCWSGSGFAKCYSQLGMAMASLFILTCLNHSHLAKNQWQDPQHFSFCWKHFSFQRCWSCKPTLHLILSFYSE